MTAAVLLCIPAALFAAGAQEAETDQITVVTTIFPLYDFAREIGGEHADVSLILPPGVEAHSFEPAPRDIVRINHADIFIYAGEAMEPWAHRVIESLSNPELVLVDISEHVALLEADDHHHDDDDDHHHSGTDPHFWTDPLTARRAVQVIESVFIQADGDHEEYYRKNSQEYQGKLEELHLQIKEAVEDFEVRTILYGGHFAFGYFAHRYGLDHVSPYRGFSPSAEPAPQSISQLIELMREYELDVVYHEELIDPRVARIIADETGAQLELLHGMHNVSREELEAGVTYLSLMEDNLQKLIEGLGTKK